MEDWIQVVVAASPGLLGVGALFQRVTRLEKDIEGRATKESVEHLQTSLAKIEVLLERLNERLTRPA